MNDPSTLIAEAVRRRNAAGLLVVALRTHTSIKAARHWLTTYGQAPGHRQAAGDAAELLDQLTAAIRET